MSRLTGLQERYEYERKNYRDAQKKLDSLDEELAPVFAQERELKALAISTYPTKQWVDPNARVHVCVDPKRWHESMTLEVREARADLIAEMDQITYRWGSVKMKRRELQRYIVAVRRAIKNLESEIEHERSHPRKPSSPPPAQGGLF